MNKEHQNHVSLDPHKKGDSPIVLEAKNLYHGYGAVTILENVQFHLRAGEKVALIGPSGIGKSTLLNVLGLMDAPLQGEIVFHQKNKKISSANCSEEKRTLIRRDMIGFVYQNHDLLPEFSALENVALAYMVYSGSLTQSFAKARILLERVGLADRTNHRPGQLSGGQRQRVAIARALIHDPLVILADEPTGSLDEATAAEIFDLFLTLTQEHSTSLLVATHNLSLCPFFDRILTLEKGQLIDVSSKYHQNAS